MSEEPEIRTRWSDMSGGIDAAQAYQRRFDDLAASGADVHGEARLVAALQPAPARILDAGCGTGRVATQLTTLGYTCVGVDADRHMIEVASERDPATLFVRGDLSTLALRTQAFDLALMAGNVVPLLAPGTLPATLARIAAHLQPLGLLVAGFGLDAEHLPGGCPVTTLADYERAAAAADLALVAHWSTWDRAPRPQNSADEGGYVVAVHRKQ
ncbi:class I SAM-dependent methyltransferase [Janibacter sp. G56]|uniref:class I SAM-dependent methyltransferase n=1 Tax=Janibacter sp. G56 TaxID=3418717 RepID=UPI003CFDB859